MAECYTPYLTKEHGFVPCGKCESCYKRTISAWSFRLMQQDRVSHTSQFITLTYDTQHVPITKNKFMSLDKRHCQLFFKRLRKANEYHGRKISYYLAGEYGETTFRPHYHVILFNVELDTILPAWGMGDCHYGTVSEASVGYSLKYISKPSRVPLHKNDDRVPEFSLKSKGLGLNYITPAIYRWHHADPEERMYCNLKDGKKIAMPRYYKQKLYDEELRKQIGEATRKRILLERETKKKLSPRDKFEAALAAKRRVAEAAKRGNKI